MKKTLMLVALCVLALLSGCTSPPSASVPLAASARSSGTLAAATLARVGTCEMDVAADFTALIMFRQRAARDVTNRVITVDQARQVQALADTVRIDLDAACPNASARLDVERRDAARATLKTIAQLLEKKP